MLLCGRICLSSLGKIVPVTADNTYLNIKITQHAILGVWDPLSAVSKVEGLEQLPSLPCLKTLLLLHLRLESKALSSMKIVVFPINAQRSQ